MLPKNPCLSLYSSSSRVQNSSQATSLMLWGSLFILLVILASFALAIAGDQFDKGDSPLFEAGLSALVAGYLYGKLLPILGLALAIFTAPMRLEYLTGRIGEKRPDSPNMSVKSVSLFARSFRTVLFSRAVFFVPVSRYEADVNVPRKVFHSC